MEPLLTDSTETGLAAFGITLAILALLIWFWLIWKGKWPPDGENGN